MQISLLVLRTAASRQYRIAGGREKHMTHKAITCRSILVFAVAVATGLGAKPLAAQATPAPEWKTYAYPAEGFSALYPQGPTLNKQNVDTAAGTVEVRSYMVDLGSTALFVAVCDYGQAAAGKDPNVLLQGAKNGAIQNAHARLTRESNITLGTYPGVEFEASSDAALFHARIYMVGTTLYQTLVVVTTGSQYPDTVRFLDSFQLIARTKS